MSGPDPDPGLLAKVLDSVRIELRQPMRIRVSRHLNGKETDSHIVEVLIGADPSTLEKQIRSVASRWKGGFPIGASYIVERLKGEDS